MAFEIYKKGQGYWTRMGTAAGLGIILACGCYALYSELQALSSYMDNKNMAGWLQAGIPAALLLVLAYVIYRALNKPKFADFMIATEGEMKKVSWSSKKEIIGSTKVVIVTVFLMAILLAAVDSIFRWAFDKIGILRL